MTKIEFTIPGVPIPWSAPRVTRWGCYSKHTNAIKPTRLFLQHTYKGQPFEGPINCSFEFYMPIPASTSKKNRQLMLERKIRPITKPDRTNLSKGYEDIFQEIFYHNDSQIVGGCVEKWYSDNPRIVVKIESVEIM